MGQNAGIFPQVGVTMKRSGVTCGVRGQRKDQHLSICEHATHPTLKQMVSNHRSPGQVPSGLLALYWPVLSLV